MTCFARALLLQMAALVLLAYAAPAHADIILSELVLDLQPGRQLRGDIEVWNDSPERSFVAIEPREIVNPALPGQEARRDPDPEKLGLLVSPARMILEPGQRKLLRVASLGAPADKEHVYRVTVKPVVGGIEGSDSGLKLIIGYDVLVLVRPAKPLAVLAGSRRGRELTLTNSGNVSVEVVDGRQCSGARKPCFDLPGKRLYPGASWSVQLKSDAPADFTVKYPGKVERRSF